MPQTVIEINGRTYTMQCGEGQEEHLQRLARMVNDEVLRIREKVGPLGEIRLLIMAALVMADRLLEQEETINNLREELQRAQTQAAGEVEKMLMRLLQTLDGASERLEGLAGRAKTVLGRQD